MKFTKMQGCGNDYVYINGFVYEIDEPEELSKKVSDRHFGVGSDGLILINPSNEADFRMNIYNADGSEAKMCGNGIRCVGKYVYDKEMTNKKIVTVETLSGIKTLFLSVNDDDKVESVRVNVGKPSLTPSEIPVVSDKEQVLDESIKVAGKKFKMTCVSMGNPHCVVFVDDVENFDIEKYGPEFENNELFPDRINTEFVQVVDKNHIKMRVWERGSGETMACGTGASASAVASYLNEFTENEVYVELLGGTLYIEYDTSEDAVYMTGPAEISFEGEIEE
ncbi:MAG: diaminopimelate epimerase [Eubacterium sp.]|nr:diaminopimelate epimerase [Eubacterium sp.]